MSKVTYVDVDHNTRSVHVGLIDGTEHQFDNLPYGVVIDATKTRDSEKFLERVLSKYPCTVVRDEWSEEIARLRRGGGCIG